LAPSCNDCFTERQAVMATTRHIRTYFLKNNWGERERQREKIFILSFHTKSNISVDTLSFVRSFASPSSYFCHSCSSIKCIWSDLVRLSTYINLLIFFYYLQYKEKYQKKRQKFKWLIDWWIQGFYSSIDRKRVIKSCWKEK
jgi:hypothetical protein